MPVNFPALFIPFHLIRNPKLILPCIIVQDIRQLDFLALKSAGYKGVIFDKDNCLTKPHDDSLVPEIRDAYIKCRDTFPNTTVVVSNSAGYHPTDPALLISESVSYNLHGTPVLSHASPKPGWACISSIRQYFASLPLPPGSKPIQDTQLVVIGDRLLTDVVLANRLGALSVWTRGSWVLEGQLTRWAEERLFRFAHPTFQMLDRRFLKVEISPVSKTKDAKVLAWYKKLLKRPSWS